MANTNEQSTKPVPDAAQKIPASYLSANPIALAKLKRIPPLVPDKAAVYVPFLNAVCEQYQINSRKRIAMFLAQIIHESQNLTRVKENLNYSADGLLNTFSRDRISVGDAKRYGRVDEDVRRRTGWNLPNQKANQEAIANTVYGGAWGVKSLGNTQPGDGWRFIGRSLMQRTGRSNYTRASVALGMDFIKHPELLEQPEWAVKSAGLFWADNNLTAYADKDDIKGCTKRINGGFVGLPERTTLWRTALALWP